MANNTHVKTSENPQENPQEKVADQKDIQKKLVDLPPQAQQLLVAEEREENDVRMQARKAMEALSRNLPALPPTSEQKLERFVA